MARDCLVTAGPWLTCTFDPASILYMSLVCSVAHPIQDATDEEMHAKCDDVYEQVIASLGQTVVQNAAQSSSKL